MNFNKFQLIIFALILAPTCLIWNMVVGADLKSHENSDAVLWAQRKGWIHAY